MLDAGITNAAGDQVITIDLIRHRMGVKVKVHVAHHVEEFFKHWGGGVSGPPSAGRIWQVVHPQDPPLRVWSFDVAVNADESQPYSLFHTGSGFITDHGTINLSFIRLVGASEGRSLIVDTVVSRTELERIALRLRKAEEQFYAEYIQSVHLSIFVGVKDRTREVG